MNRKLHIESFLQKVHWKKADRVKLGQDASFRQYWRLSFKDKTALLMDAPPPEKPVSVFADIAIFLREHGLHAPEIYAMDASNGLMLIEDFGDATFTRILHEQPEQEWALYDLAVDSLVGLHQIRSFDTLSVPRYSTSALNEELQLYLDWFFPAITGKSATKKQSLSYMNAWARSFNYLPAETDVLVLRDFHVDNLMRLPGADNKDKCGILDFQDAFIGSPAYDLVSLIEDARRDISSALRSHCLKRYVSKMSGASKYNVDLDSYKTALNVYGAQRHAKVLGIFVRLKQRDNKALYLEHLPRVLALYLAAIEREPALAEVAKWTEEHLPICNLASII